jgi:hypothetical protein
LFPLGTQAKSFYVLSILSSDASSAFNAPVMKRTGRSRENVMTANCMLDNSQVQQLAE